MAEPARPAGYSGTPLAKKLGIRDGSSVVALGAPSNYQELLAPLPKDVRIAGRLTAGTDVVHLFAAKRSELRAAATEAAVCDQAGRRHLGVLAEEGGEAADRCNRGRDSRDRATARLG